jgi:hypothetical protein
MGRLYTSTTQDFNGYLEEIRVSHTARWTSNFTVPSVPYFEDGIYVGVGGAVGGGGAAVDITAPYLFDGVGGAVSGGLSDCDSYNLFPIHHWTFDDINSTTAYDGVSQGNVNVSCTNWSQTIGKFQYGISQPSTVYPKHLAQNILFKSVSIWFKRLSTSMFTTVLSCEDWSQGMIHVNPNYGGAIFAKSFGGAYSDTGLSVTDTAWHHLVLTKITDTSAYLYIDGVKSAAFPWLFSAGVDYFSAYAYISSSTENADIDNIQVYDRSISDSEVTFLYNAQLQTDTLPVTLLIIGSGGAISGGLADVILSGVVSFTGAGGAIGGGSAITRWADIEGQFPELYGSIPLWFTTAVSIGGVIPAFYGSIDTGWFVAGKLPDIFGDVNTIHTIQMLFDGILPDFYGDSSIIVISCYNLNGIFPKLFGDISALSKYNYEIDGIFPSCFGDVDITNAFNQVSGAIPPIFGDINIGQIVWSWDISFPYRPHVSDLSVVSDASDVLQFVQ